MSEARKTTSVKATETARKVRPLVRAMYTGAHQAKVEGRPVAYCMAVSMFDEILRAMDIYPLWTENYAGLCAAKRVAEPYLMAAEADGISDVVCGYVRVGMGFDCLRRKGQTPDTAPDGGMAMPDLLLGSSYRCDPRFKWYQALGRYMDVPTYCHDVVIPPVGADLDTVKDHFIKYQAGELRGLVSFLEARLGKKMDYDRLWQVIGMAEETNRWWYEAYQLRKAVPSPMPAEDHFNCFVPGYFMMGTPEALNFYRELYQEVKQRVDSKTGVIPEEKYRLLWAGGLPPWHTMWMMNYFESMGAVFVTETSYRPWEPVEVPPSVTDPFEHIAHRAFQRFTYRHRKAQQNSGNTEVELLLEMMQQYRTDGMVTHATRSCRAMTIGQLHWKNLVQKYSRTPFLQLISDIVDLRDYSEAQWKMQIDAFVETVATAKGQD